MNQSVVCLVLFLIVDYVYTCTTPAGRRSQCISLYECPQLMTAFQQTLTTPVINFLRNSQCGFSGDVPRVCCGPVPSNLYEVAMPRPTTTTQSSRGTPDANINVDPALQEDSSPAPRNQCGQDESDRIYGGQITELDEFPWMALLGYKTRLQTLQYACGGTLINQRYVLTAAHCVTGRVERDVGKLTTVRLGEYDTQQDQDCLNGVCADRTQDIPVAGTYPHPGFSDTNTNRQDDISLVRLARRARYSFYVKPICLVDSSARLDLGHTVYVAGWGKTLQGGSSPVKLKLSLPIFDKDDCASKYRSLGANLLDKQICAGGKFAQDSCKGDSGGPLMRRRAEGVWEAVGVVSFGHGCGRDGWPGVYTSVASYDDWIRSTLRSTNV